MAVQLSTVEDALSYLVSLSEEGATGDEEIEFSGELAKLSIEIDGPRYHGTVPGELARGLWQLQESIYAAGAFALTGIDDIRKLSAEQRAALELVFEVEEGSTDVWAALAGMFTKLGEGFASMDSLSKSRVMIVIALIAAGGFGLWKILDVTGDVKKENVKASMTTTLEAERTKQFEVFARALTASPAAQKFDAAVSEGARAVARGANDATSIKVGRVEFDSEEIQEINQRATRQPSEARVVETEFRVISAEMRNPDQSRYVLSSAETGEFTAVLNESETAPGDIDRLIAAVRTRQEIRLEVSVTRNRGVVRAAQIMAIVAPTQSAQGTPSSSTVAASSPRP